MVIMMMASICITYQQPCKCNGKDGVPIVRVRSCSGNGKRSFAGARGNVDDDNHSSTSSTRNTTVIVSKVIANAT